MGINGKTARSYNGTPEKIRTYKTHEFTQHYTNVSSQRTLMKSLSQSPVLFVVKISMLCFCLAGEEGTITKSITGLHPHT